MVFFTRVEPEAPLDPAPTHRGRRDLALSALRPLSGAKSLDDIRQCLARFAAALYACHFAFLVIERGPAALSTVWAIADMPGWWAALTAELHPLLSSSEGAPCGAHAAHTWFRVQSGGSPDAELQRLGVRLGVLVPAECQQPGDTAACLVLGFGEDPVAWDTDYRREVVGACAHAASLSLDVYVRGSRRTSRAAAGISARERECLRWAAVGKTSSETAAILGVTERTVNFHFGNAFAKLRVNNKQAAVAQAILRALL